MMGFDNITVLTHHLENRFERFRSGTEQLDEPTMNLVLRCIDFLRQCNDRLRDGEQLGSPDRIARRIEAIGRTERKLPSEARRCTGKSGHRAQRVPNESSNRWSMQQTSRPTRVC